MLKASRGQIARIHILAQQLGLDDETYRAMLRAVTGRRSCKELTHWQASEVIRHLERCGAKPRRQAPRPRKYEDLGEDRPRMASPAQLRMIEAIWGEIALGDPTRTLRRFLFNKWTVSDLRFLEDWQASEVIEAIKAMRRRYGAREVHDGQARR
jgi:hypothetical protein